MDPKYVRYFAMAPLVSGIFLGIAGCGGKGEASNAAASGNGNSEQAVAQCGLFPAQSIFYQRIDDAVRFPKHASSDGWVASVGSTTAFHPDWGNDVNPASGSYYGIPFNAVTGASGDTDWATLSYDYGGASDESDCAQSNAGSWQIRQDCSVVATPRFPVPASTTVLTEGGSCNDPNTCGDHHLIVLESGSCRLWEAYQGYRINGQWTASSTAAWNLNSMSMRPEGWTSADAAGFPILPLLARASEATQGTVAHALRVTFAPSVMDSHHVWPASHDAGTPRSGAIPLGAVLRLRSDFVAPSNWTTQAKALVQAMQRYGLYVADRGSNLFVQGEPNAAWSDDTITQLKTLRMNQFEFVDLSTITSDSRFSSTSYQAAW